MKRNKYILDVIELLINCLENLLEKDAKIVSNTFQKIEFLKRIEEIEGYYIESGFQKKYSNAMAEILSVKASSERVLNLACNNGLKMSKKLEFELLPLIECLRLSFYYWNWVGEDSEKKKKFFEEDVKYYYRNRYMEKSRKEGKYKYELSITVTGYNKLEYTKKCIHSLKKYLPKNITYELIFLNHGSMDGTKEFFESQSPNKQVDVEVNGGARTVIDRIVEGKYRLAISNDVLITENSISNLYKCIKSDEKIGWVVPSTPNVSNLQTLDANYKTLEEMYEFAKKNNVSDPDRWEERPRLCNPIDIRRVEDWFEIVGRKTLVPGGISFPDDIVSYIFRRNGYKLILAKDVYCYHFGSVTIGEQIRNQQKAQVNYCKGRINFIKQFNMDPWGYGMAYDVALMTGLDVRDVLNGNILGINSGIGANPLKIKSLLKEYTEIKDAKITYISQYTMNLKDLKGLGDKVYEVQNWTEIKYMLNEKYDFILLENGVSEINIKEIDRLKIFLSEKGIMLVRITSQELYKIIKYRSDIKKVINSGTCIWVFLN